MVPSPGRCGSGGGVTGGGQAQVAGIPTHGAGASARDREMEEAFGAGN